ncbi:hypothetical protein RFI_04375 [Reticulomyxa filosa]|uniref:Uncharacterized protein n=1 Tax=Reticulomyxa filosa TaxID=46433 RepID=X6P3F6_RETFI|nr:hypothetical protein RFI_04375 [Reticulomyxa filosa]|eukprot:ETO32741.1 hypothetical protein RFI_04375 [Reticulomyxa filosa]
MLRKWCIVVTLVFRNYTSQHRTNLFGYYQIDDEQQILNGKNERDNRYFEKFWNDLVFSKEKGKYCFKDGSTILLISFFFIYGEKEKKVEHIFSCINCACNPSSFLFLSCHYLYHLLVPFCYFNIKIFIKRKIKTTTIRTQRQKICGKCQIFVIKNDTNLSLFALRFTVLTGTATTTTTFSIKKVLYSLKTYVLYVSIDHTYFN